VGGYEGKEADQVFQAPEGEEADGEVRQGVRQILQESHEMRISLGFNAVPKKAKELIEEVWKSGQFSPGPKCREFEEKFSKKHDAKYGVFVNSGTDAIRLGLLALKSKYEWRDGDLVAVPAVTFVATINAVLQSGLKPFFVDVSAYDYLINPWNLTHRIECSAGGVSRLRAMVPVHLFGQSCQKETFEIAKQLNLKILEDSCETILNPIRGDVSCHSTYMAHHMTTGVGGIALTNDHSLATLIRSFANHGRNTDYLPGHTPCKDIKKRFQFNRIGYSCRATEFEAAMGLSQLEGLPKVVVGRRAVAQKLSEALYPFDDLVVLPEDHHSTWMMYPIMLRGHSTIDKYNLCEHLERGGIETRDMMPITNQPCYQEFVKESEYPVAEQINRRGFYIPCSQNMTEKDVARIQKIFAKYLTNRKRHDK